VKLLAFGEILWDIVADAKYLGGAPFNLAAHAARCGAQAAILSRLGCDALGAEALAAVTQYGVDDHLVQQDADHATGTVEVTVSDQGQPSYLIHESVAYDYIDLSASVLDDILAQSFDVFCFGTLAQRAPASQKSLARLLKGLRGTSTRVFCDINLRQHFYQQDLLEVALAVSDIVKLNEDEAAVLADLLYKDAALPRPVLCEQLSRDFDLDILLVTLGAEGVGVYAEGQYHALAGCPVQVADTIGAGDAFSAVFLTRLFQGDDPVQAASMANQIGAYVASKPGALPPYNDHIKKSLHERIGDA
jgi:fructokinase